MDGFSSHNIPAAATNTSRQGPDRKPFTALGLDDLGQPRVDPLTGPFGIDFGHATTKVAGMRGDRPFLIAELDMSGFANTQLNAFASEPMNFSEQFQLFGALREQLRQVDFDNETFVQDRRYIGAREFFSTIKKMLARHTFRPEAVITVPAFYCSSERELLWRCAQDAGITVLGLVNDYAAAMSAYACYRKPKPRRLQFLVLSMGAEVVSCALILHSLGFLGTRSAKSNVGIGTNFMIESLATEMEKHFRNEPTVNVDVAKIDWKEEAVSVLRESGTEEKMQSKHSFSFETSVIQKSIESALSPVVALMDETLHDVRVKKEKLEYILFVGRSTQFPLVQRLIIEKLSSKYCVILNPVKSQSYGAALAAHSIKNDSDEHRVFDVLSQAVFVKNEYGEYMFGHAGAQLPIQIQVRANPGLLLRQNRFSTEFQPNQMQEVASIPINAEVDGKELDMQIDKNGIISTRLIDALVRPDYE